jgi:hypothetical protein
VPSQAGHLISTTASLDFDFFIKFMLQKTEFYPFRCLKPAPSLPFVGGGGCGVRLPFGRNGRMLSAVGIVESTMSKAGLDNRHRNHDGEISHKHGNTLVGTLRKIYGQSFAAGYPSTEKLSEVLLQLNETSLSQLRRDHETGHLSHKIASASK